MMNRPFSILILLLFVMVPQMTKAQWAFDFVSVEAYINDHKKQRSLLLARSTLELSNQLLHEYSSDATVEYKTLNVDLDKYTRAFDVIDVLYQSLRTSLKIYPQKTGSVRYSPSAPARRSTLLPDENRVRNE